MAKFLATTGTNYHLEELIKGASDRLILISPFLKLNDRMKELHSDQSHSGDCQGIGGRKNRPAR